jgi:hypothetical protein
VLVEEHSTSGCVGGKDKHESIKFVMNDRIFPSRSDLWVKTGFLIGRARFNGGLLQLVGHREGAGAILPRLVSS